MNPLELFLLKACICLLVFYAPYSALFSRTTFFTVNRIYLLAALILSFLLPLVVIPTSEELIPKTILEFYEPILTQPFSIPAPSESITKTLGFSSILLIIYFVGLAVQIARLFFSIQSILKIKNLGEISIVDKVKIVRTDFAEPFTFLNMIFLPKSGTPKHIFVHEKTHVLQFHWLDLIIVQVASIILWFNPIMIAYKRSLKMQHEYLADYSLIKKGIKLEEYLNCMTNHLNPVKQFDLISSFYFQSIKKRITMLTKKKTSQQLAGLYFIIVPLITCLLLAFAPKPNHQLLNYEAADSVVQHDLQFISPIKASLTKLSSGFGERMHPILGYKKFHTGIDLISPEGVEVMSTEDGVVSNSNYDSLRGNFIIIKHNDSYSTFYSHLKVRAVEAGEKVKKEQAIGLVGNTGLSTESHLHFEILKDEKPVDPQAYLPEIK
jgi:Peptidase family M23/BlaR1 peptidase M56